MAVKPAFNQQRAMGDAAALGSLWRYAANTRNARVRGDMATRLAEFIMSEADYTKRGELLAAFVEELG